MKGVIKRVCIILIFLLPLNLKGQDYGWWKNMGTGRCNGIFVGPGGAVYVAGRKSDSFAVFKFTSDGIKKWVYEHGHSQYGEEAYDVIRGSDGNIYICGKTIVSYTYGPTDMFTVLSLKSDGSFRWIYTFNTEHGGQAEKIIEGSDGNIYVCGFVDREVNNDSRRSAILISLTKSGNFRWKYEVQVNGSFPDYDAYFMDIYAGSNGNIYGVISIRNPGQTNGWDIQVVSLTINGQENWVYNYHGQNKDFAWEMDGDENNNLYICAESVDANGIPKFTVISLNSNGGLRWVYTPQDAYSGTAMSIVYGDDGNVYVTGALNYQSSVYGTSSQESYSNNFINKTEYILNVLKSPNNQIGVVSLTSDGNENWKYIYDGPASLNDLGVSIDYGYDGNIYVAGYSNGINTQRDFTVIKVLNNGKEGWVFRKDVGVNDFTQAIYARTQYGVFAGGFVKDYDLGDFVISKVHLQATLIWPNSPNIVLEERKTYYIRYSGYSLARIKEAAAWFSPDGGANWTKKLGSKSYLPYPTEVTDDSIEWIVDVEPTLQGRVKVILHGKAYSRVNKVSNYNLKVLPAKPTFLSSFSDCPYTMTYRVNDKFFDFTLKNCYNTLVKNKKV